MSESYYLAPLPSGCIIRQPTPAEIHRLATRDVGESDGIDDRRGWEIMFGLDEGELR